MKKILLGLVVSLTCTAAFADTDTKTKQPQLTPEQIQMIQMQQQFIAFAVSNVTKSNFKDNCVAGNVTYKRLNESDAKKYCHCRTEAYANDLSLVEFWQLNKYILEDDKAISQYPAYKRVAKKMDECKKGFDIKEPQKP